MDVSPFRKLKSIPCRPDTAPVVRNNYFRESERATPVRLNSRNKSSSFKFSSELKPDATPQSAARPFRKSQFRRAQDEINPKAFNLIKERIMKRVLSIKQ